MERKIIVKRKFFFNIIAKALMTAMVILNIISLFIIKDDLWKNTGIIFLDVISILLYLVKPKVDYIVRY